MSSNRKTDLSKLEALADFPAEQAAFAFKMISARRNAQFVISALRTLTQTEAHEQRLEDMGATARAALLECYAYYDADPIKRDPSSPVRAALINTLHRVSHPDDLPLLERAAATYERIPPGFWEEAGILRAAAVSALARLDRDLAAYHAVRLLGEDTTTLSGMMSGEPGQTAIRVLAAQGLAIPIYAYLIQESGEGVPEAIAEGLRALGSSSCPPSLIPGLIAKYCESTAEMVVGALFDLVIMHPEGRNHADFILEFLQNSLNRTVYRYVATALVATRKTFFLQLLLRAADAERDPRRAGWLAEALTLLRGSPEIDEALKKLTATATLQARSSSAMT